MNLRFHTDPSVFYDQSGNLYPEPKETHLFFDIGIARFNLCSFIENLERKIDLKLFYAKSRPSD